MVIAPMVWADVAFPQITLVFCSNQQRSPRPIVTRSSLFRRCACRVQLDRLSQHSLLDTRRPTSRVDECNGRPRPSFARNTFVSTGGGLNRDQCLVLRRHGMLRCCKLHWELRERSPMGTKEVEGERREGRKGRRDGSMRDRGRRASDARWCMAGASSRDRDREAGVDGHACPSV